MDKSQTQDELMTPGCANCAVKHLSAALAFIADGAARDIQLHVFTVLAARAYVNLTEVPMGYRSHFPFAIGLLARAEAAAVGVNAIDYAAAFRGFRLRLVSEGESAIPGVLTDLEVYVSPEALTRAHLSEAEREFPALYGVPADAETIIEKIREIRDAYFFINEERKGGDEDMASKKKAPAAKAGLTEKAATAKKGKGKCTGKKCK